MRLKAARRKADRERAGRAAVYIRMSTDHQRYSVAFQKIALSQYADAGELEIVESYIDEGKSGLDIAGRPALQRLIRDIETGTTAFSKILVYDVSRWGRWQNSDEAAYYEFLCVRFDVEILYCAESFINDGSLASSVAKALRRSMASEYSRDLSTRIFLAQCEMVRRGIWRGAKAPYGYRRMLCDERGDPLALLELGQTKFIKQHRVNLVLGPSAEIETIRWIFEQYATKRRPQIDIANELNALGVPSPRNLAWLPGAIVKTIRNEVYIGNYVYAKTSRKLKAASRTLNPAATWVRMNGAFPAIVDESLFQVANERLEGGRHITDAELLDWLRMVWAKEGRVTYRLLVKHGSGVAPCASTFNNRFDSLCSAYDLIGYPYERDTSYIHVNRLRGRILAEVLARLPGLVPDMAWIGKDKNSISRVIRHGDLRLLVIVARALPRNAGGPRWLVRIPLVHEPNSFLIVLPNRGHTAPDRFVVPDVRYRFGEMPLDEQSLIRGESITVHDLDDLRGFFEGADYRRPHFRKLYPAKKHRNAPHTTGVRIFDKHFLPSGPGEWSAFRRHRSNLVGATR